MPYVSDESKTWTAHLGDRLADKYWTILKGGGCAWCDEQRKQARTGPLQIDEIISLLRIHHGDADVIDKKHLSRLYHHGLAHRIGMGDWEPTDNGRRFVEAIRALGGIDWVG
jgi:hypothetical protein